MRTLLILLSTSRPRFDAVIVISYGNGLFDSLPLRFIIMPIVLASSALALTPELSSDDSLILISLWLELARSLFAYDHTFAFALIGPNHCLLLLLGFEQTHGIPLPFLFDMIF